MSDADSFVTNELPCAAGPHAWRLRACSGGLPQESEQAGRVRVVRRGEVLSIGSGGQADWTLADAAISGLHCRLEAGAEGLLVADLESKNGTFVGSGRIREALIGAEGGVFMIGRTSVQVERRAEVSAGNDLGLIGSSQAIQTVRAKIRRFAPLRGPVLVVGESGTGKDVVARALHTESRRLGSYFPLNVAALADSLLDAELFGHTRGAFTGAATARTGLFEMASGGTLFLDEIADLSAAGQAKLLRVVEEGKVRAVGSSDLRRVDARLVSATCAPLLERISQGAFREDLYHRLSMLVIELPPLRRRSKDIPALCEHYLKRIGEEVGRKYLLPATLSVLKSAPWPGNVRQLFGTLYRAAALCPGDTLEPAHLQLGPGMSSARPRLSAAKALQLLDSHGSISAAARAAGVPRTTFRSVMERDRIKRAT